MTHSTDVDSLFFAGSGGTWNPARNFGGLAQLGERLHGMQKVRGSSPLSSTSLTSWVYLSNRVVFVLVLGPRAVFRIPLIALSKSSSVLDSLCFWTIFGEFLSHLHTTCIGYSWSNSVCR